MANINLTVLAIFFINICCVNIIYFIKIFYLAIKGKGVKMKFNVGDRVKIISRERMRYATGRNSSGLMDKYGEDRWFKYLIKSYNKNLIKWNKQHRGN